MKLRMILCAALATSALHGVAANAELPPLIPREVLFGNPDKASPRISPDGNRLAYAARNLMKTASSQDDIQIFLKDF